MEEIEESLDCMPTPSKLILYWPIIERNVFFGLSEANNLLI